MTRELELVAEHFHLETHASVGLELRSAPFEPAEMVQEPGGHHKQIAEHDS